MHVRDSAPSVGRVEGQADRAEEIARSLLEVPLPQRWAHTQGVAAQARTLAPVLGDEADLIEAAAWLHDVGYSPALAATGFHPLDGARYLRDAQGPATSCAVSWPIIRAPSSRQGNAVSPAN